MPPNAVLVIESLRYAGGVAAVTVLGDPSMGRMPDDAARIEGGEFNGNTPDEVPDEAATGEDIRHGKPWMSDDPLDSAASPTGVGPKKAS